MKCRFCHTPLVHVFADLGLQPPSNSFIKKENLKKHEDVYPLKIWTCDKCFLTQIDEFKSHAEIFSKDYAYFSSYSSSWVAHAKTYAEKMAGRFKLGPQSMVIEVASNDGYLLQHFKGMNIPCLGIEPTASTAAAARLIGIDTREMFFGTETAAKLVAEGISADLTAANNVLAHVPDINDFMAGFRIILKPEGIATFEFPHLMQLVAHHQFDTIYHEHFSYLSLMTVEKIFEQAGLRVFDVEEIPTHGGSLRLYVCKDGAGHARSPHVDALIAREKAAGMDGLAYYSGFQSQVDKIRHDLKAFLKQAKAEGKKVCGYGAAAKGNTLLNSCHIKADMIAAVADLSPHKQGLYMPGSHIPVVSPAEMLAQKPDYIIIFPWNLRHEIVRQLTPDIGPDTQFVVAIPALEVFR